MSGPTWDILRWSPRCILPAGQAPHQAPGTALRMMLASSLCRLRDSLMSFSTAQMRSFGRYTALSAAAPFLFGLMRRMPFRPPFGFGSSACETEIVGGPPSVRLQALMSILVLLVVLAVALSACRCDGVQMHIRCLSSDSLWGSTRRTKHQHNHLQSRKIEANRGYWLIESLRFSHFSSIRKAEKWSCSH